MELRDSLGQPAVHEAAVLLQANSQKRDRVQPSPSLRASPMARWACLTGALCASGS